MLKIKTIKLTHFSYPNPDTVNGEPRQHEWRVVQITDSVEFHPGQILTKNDVESLCEASAWKVTITENKEDI